MKRKGPNGRITLDWVLERGEVPTSFLCHTCFSLTLQQLSLLFGKGRMTPKGRKAQACRHSVRPALCYSWPRGGGQVPFLSIRAPCFARNPLVESKKSIPSILWIFGGSDSLTLPCVRIPFGSNGLVAWTGSSQGKVGKRGL